MKRKACIGFFLAGVLLFLSACANNSAGDGDAVSAGAVGTEEDTGGGTAGAVTAKEEESFWFCGGYSCNCSENYAYWGVSKGTALAQCRWNGKTVEEFPLELPDKYKDPGIIVLRVTEGEIYFVVEYEDKEDESGLSNLWCCPIKGEGENEKPDTDRIERVLSVEELRPCFIGEDMVAGYDFRESLEYLEFDRESEKEIPVDRDSDRTYYMTGHYEPPLCQYTGSMEGEYVLLASEEEHEKEGVYIHKVGSGKVTKLMDRDYATRSGRPLPVAFLGEEKCFYTCGLKFGESLEYDYTTGERHYDLDYDIWSYDYATGEKRLLLAQEDWQDWVRTQKKSAGEEESFLVEHMYQWGDRLYISLYGAYVPSMWFSVSLVDSSLRYEEKMTEGRPPYTDYMLGCGSKIFCLGCSDDLSEKKWELFDLETGERVPWSKEESMRWEAAVLANMVMYHCML